jgi:parallel beta helix pectate lyase-like protein
VRMSAHRSALLLAVLTANRNGGHGLSTAAGYSVATRAEARNNSSGGIDTTGTESQVRNNTIGIRLTGCCNLVSHGLANGHHTGILVEDCCNAVLDSGGNGIVVHGGDNTVVWSRANSNNGHGLTAQSAETRAIDVTASHNLSAGIMLNAGANNAVTHATTRSNAGEGTRVDCPSNVLRLTASGSARGNLVPSDGTCTGLRSKAP